MPPSFNAPSIELLRMVELALVFVGADMCIHHSIAAHLGEKNAFILNEECLNFITHAI